MWPNLQKTADLATFTQKMLNGKLHFLCIELDFHSSFYSPMNSIECINNYWHHFLAKSHAWVPLDFGTFFGLLDSRLRWRGSIKLVSSVCPYAGTDVRTYVSLWQVLFRRYSFWHSDRARFLKILFCTLKVK